ncbi:hypothetical protein GCM10027429_19090 [Marivirga atlantica]|uniref:Uncharacterized protein n=1 Tax=Marivirga atlantica TaxID=1548457 RepID=A0A937AF20_9BACT|nr:hypothetical protein [Marivirga atlantica]MBL0765526.1 hypothetical protein [Marivirga atlantica]
MLSIKKKLLAYKVERGLKKNRYLPKAFSYKELRKVGVIFTFDDLKKHEAVKSFIKTLEADGIEVKSLGYKPKETQNFEFYFDFFEDKDVNFFAQMKSPYMLGFLNQKFDYIFCLDDDLNLYMQYLLVNAKSSIRIGALQDTEAENRFFELMVKPKNTQDTKQLTTEIIQNIRKISGNEQ